VTIISSVGKAPAPEARRDPRVRMPGRYEGAIGPRFEFLPYVSETVLLGAAVGAIIGHQRGERTKGALIGAAAGLLFDSLNWRSGSPW
jgi:hypothetical protein